MSAVDVTASTIVAAPREDVAAYVTDHRNDPVWIGGITESQLEGDPPVAVGSRVRRVASFLGKRIEYVNEVVRLEPGSVLEMRSVKSPFPMVVTYSFEDADGGTPDQRPGPGRPERPVPPGRAAAGPAGQAVGSGRRRAAQGDPREGAFVVTIHGTAHFAIREGELETC
ncbi:MAG TPA: SRPBCC family protein, partial [Actinomycetota bacterium]